MWLLATLLSRCHTSVQVTSSRVSCALQIWNHLQFIHSFPDTASRSCRLIIMCTHEIFLIIQGSSIMPRISTIRAPDVTFIFATTSIIGHPLNGKQSQKQNYTIGTDLLPWHRGVDVSATSVPRPWPQPLPRPCPLELPKLHPLLLER